MVTMTETKTGARWGSKASRIELLQRLRAEGVTEIHALTARLGVDERTVHRYLTEFHGGPRRRIVYTQYRPVILQHMQKFPQTWFSAWDFCRRLGIPTTGDQNRVKRVLMYLRRDGLVRSRREPRDPSTDQLCTRWQITDAGMKEEVTAE